MIQGISVCRERRGVQHRHLTEVPADAYLERYLADRCKAFPDDIKDFSWLWMPGVRVVLVDDVGAILQGGLELSSMPDVHCIFWDKILAGREAMCYNVGKEFARDAGSPGVWTAIGVEYRPVLAFARRIGFELQTFVLKRGVAILTLLFT